MKANRLYIRLLLGWLLSFSALAESDMSKSQDHQLEKLFELTLAQNPTIQYTQAQQASAQSQQKIAQSMQGLQLHYKGDLGYAWMKQNSFARSANRLEATYPLYEPDKQDLYSVASYQYEANKLQVEEVKQAQLLEVSKYYFQYWSQQAELAFLEKDFASITEIMEQVNQRLRVGYQDLNDISDVQSRLDANRAQRIKVEQGIAVTRLNIEQLVGSAIDWKLFIKPQGLPAELPEPDTSHKLNEVINDHSSIRGLEQRQSASEKQVDYAKSKDGIMLKAYGAYINNQSDGNFYDDMQGVKAGLQLNLPLYQSGRTDAAVAKARADTQSIEAQKRRKQLMLIASLKTAYISVQSGLKQLQALEAAKSSNQQSVKSAEKGITTNNRNILDLLDAQRNLHKTERDIRVTENNIWQNWYLYQWSQGQIAQNR